MSPVRVGIKGEVGPACGGARQLARAASPGRIGWVRPARASPPEGTGAGWRTPKTGDSAAWHASHRPALT